MSERNKKYTHLDIIRDENNFTNTIKETTREINFTISSINRDWNKSINESPFNFKVKFNSNTNGINIEYLPKNILSISLDKLILDNRNHNIAYSTESINLLKYPYVLVNIGETIDGNVYGDSLINASIGQMIPDETFENSGFVELKNSLTKSYEYINGPKASLANMDITITQPDNNNIIINNIADVLEIDNITYINTDIINNGLHTEFLVIKTKKYFHSQQYHIGDRIKIKDYIYRDTNIYEESIPFNDYINRAEGHFIIQVAVDDEDKLLKNYIYIATPSAFNYNNGLLEASEWFEDLKLKSMGDISTSTLINDLSGKLINCNLQTTLIFKFKILDKTPSFVNVKQ